MSCGRRDPDIPESPDPLVSYRWDETAATDGLQVYFLKPVCAVTDSQGSFQNLESLTGDTASVAVSGTGSIRLDFGVVSAAWLEMESPDLSGDVEMSISEYNEPAVVNIGPRNPVKTKKPEKYGNVYRLELNDLLYEGVRFAWQTGPGFLGEYMFVFIRHEENHSLKTVLRIHIVPRFGPWG